MRATVYPNPTQRAYEPYVVSYRPSPSVMRLMAVTVEPTATPADVWAEAVRQAPELAEATPTFLGMG